MKRLAPAALALAALSSCGYHVAGKADLLPKTIHTIAIPAWDNLTTRYQLTDMLPAAVSREFISRTRYRIVADPNIADAILYGTIISYRADPTVYDPATNRAAAVQVSVILQARLIERDGGKVLYQRPSFEMKARYEISVDERAFFDESAAAMQRLSRDTARSLVSSILEQF